MFVDINHLSFRPNINDACFKISFSISSYLFFFRSAINSTYSGVKVSFFLNDSVECVCFTHLSKEEGVSSCSRMISTRGLPAR